MSEPLPPPALSRAREQKINELSQHFANDDLSLEDLERRIERVYQAASIAEIDQVTSDLRALVPVNEPGAKRSRKDQSPVPTPHMDSAGLPVPGYEIPYTRISAIMSNTRRVGRWAVPRDLRMFAMMTDSRLDLTNAALPVGGVVNIDLTAIMASIKIIVPPGMRVINEMHSFMAEVSSAADELETEGGSVPGTPVIRITGTAFMTEVKVKVRRREEPVFDDE
jgi:hypothetical protein